MLDRATVDRLRRIDAGGALVVSVYLGLGPSPEELRSVPARLKALLAPLRDLADSLDEAAARRLRDDLDTVLGMGEVVGGDLGRGTALFVSAAAGVREHVSLPIGVRDRAVADPTPYLGPLEAILGHFHRYCAVVVDRRTASIFRFSMGTLESWEEIAAEEVRKGNYGGFQGYDEHRVRGRTGEVARRQFRSVAERLAALRREDEFDLLVIGGNQANVDGLVAELAPTLTERLAGTFVVDPGTVTPAEVRDRCREAASRFEAARDADLVEEIREAAGSGGRAVLGLDRVLDAVNQRAVDLLAVAASESTPGVRCVDCGWLMRRGSLCAACGEATRAVADLVDEAAEQTRRRGGRVRYLVGEARPDDFEVAALVRFAVPVLGG